MGSVYIRLATADLNQLLAAAQADTSDNSASMNTIIQRFEPLVQATARGLTPCPDLRQDLANVARLALVRAVRGHDLSRNGFPNYARLFVRGAARRELQRQTSCRTESLVDLALARHVPRALIDDTEMTVDLWGGGALSDAVSQLPERQRTLLGDRYAADATLLDIARHSGTSESAVSQRLRSAHRAVAKRLTAA